MRARFALLLALSPVLAATTFLTARGQVSNPGIQQQGPAVAGHCPVYVNANVMQDSGAGCGASGSLPTVAALTGLVNTTGGVALPVSTTLTAWIDAAIGSTVNSFLLRGASTWGLGAFGAEFSVAASTVHVATGGITAAMLANTAVTPGAYTSANITVDQQGRITAAANGSGGGGTPAAPSTSLQFNNGGAFGGSAVLTWVSPKLTVGVNASTTGQIGLANGGGSGVTVTLQNPSATTAYNYNFPATAGTSGQVETSGGGLSAPNTWTTLATVATTGSASDLGSGTLASARGGAGSITGALRGNGAGVVTQAACGDLSNAVASCSTDTTNAANISSGTLGVIRGGTGQSAYTDGQVLIGNTATGLLSKTTLTAGSGTTITNGNGTITIASTGSGGVSGPGTSINGDLACWSGVSGNALVDCGVQGVPVTQKTSGSPYTVLAADMYTWVVANTAGAYAITMPQAGTTGFEANKWLCFADRGAGTLTVTVTTSIVYGALSLVLPTNTTLCLTSDGTNYVGQNGQLAVDGATITATAGVLGVPNGGITNAKLQNSSVTVGGQSIALGGSTTNQGTGAKLQLSTGTTTTNNCTKYDVNGNTVDAGNPCGTVTSITPGAGVASTRTGGTSAVTSAGTLFADASYFPMFMGGCTLSNDGGSPNTTIDIAVCASASDDNTVMMKSAAFTKSITTWALGSGNGCLDTGAVAQNTWYTYFQIERSDTGVVDILCSLSATAPTFPTNYDKKRRLGAVRTGAATTNILPFTQIGNAVYWTTAILDVNTSSLSTSAALQTLSVPPGVKTMPICRVTISNASTASVLLTSPDETDVAPTTTNPFTAAPGFDNLDVTLAAGTTNGTCPMLTTNTASQIRARATAASTTLAIVTRGYID